MPARMLRALRLSNDVDMSDPKDSDARERQGVLANLPRTRPQRSSARRTAARQATARPPASKTRSSAGVEAPVRKPARAERPSRRGGTATRPTRSGPSRADKRVGADGLAVPRQGFESESERSSKPVQPPGAPELVASAAEIVGELAKSGLSAGERLLKDVLSRLPLA